MKRFLAAVSLAAAAAARWWKLRTALPEDPTEAQPAEPPHPNAVHPEWCVVANLLPYPYNPGPKADYRSHRIFPAGAKLHVIGGFAGRGHEVVTVTGTNHQGRIVTSNITARYLGGWRVSLIHRPAVLHAIHRASSRYPAHRWNHRNLPFDSPEYEAVLRERAAGFQEWLHGSR
ncbi:hypothetical protein [Nocardia sp. NPDC057668]|uniref:hypothetical protein n=1 Tax=Nocardia sp. NPDC057668 TaxID=3346202 RepID=UPI00366E2992